MTKFSKTKYILLSVIGLIILYFIALNIYYKYQESHSHGWARAVLFINNYRNQNDTAGWAISNHSPEPEIKPDTDLVFFNGGEILHYTSSNQVLTVKSFNIDGEKSNDTPESIANIHKVFDAFNDPKIGGMFDKGGGYFSHSDDWKNIYLSKDYSIEKLSINDFLSQIKHQDALNKAWFDHWGIAVAEIVHKGKPIPTTPVTLENNPYK